jgi:hydroxyacylglutathione hydrolase
LCDKILHTPKRKDRGLKEDAKKDNFSSFESGIGECLFHGIMLSRAPMNVHQIPVRKDNYIHLLEDPHLDHCVVIDATDFEKIDAFCETQKKRLSAILITHHHEDHINAILKLTKKYDCPVYGFQKDAYRIAGLTHFVKEGESLFYGDHSIQVLETPGHTLGHISYYLDKQKRLFCGDVIFRFGCGRLFEGSPEMMLHTLQKLRALPDATTVYCAHEYTLSNLDFCINLEPNNKALQNTEQELRLVRQQNLPTVPFLLKEQKELSPFLRWDDPTLKTALGQPQATGLETFTDVRKRRNQY